MGTKPNPETFDVIVSESVLLNGRFGVYGVSSAEPGLQRYLSGGFESIDEAIQEANCNVLVRLRNAGLPIPENYAVQYRKRDDIELPETFPLLTKANLVKSVTEYINQWYAKLTKKKLLR